MATPLIELRQQAAAKASALKHVFDEAGPDRDFSKVTSLGDGDTAAKLEKVRALNAELNDIQQQVEQAQGIEDMATKAADADRHYNQPANGFTHADPAKGGTRAEAERKSPGAAFVESAAYKNWRPGSSGQTAGADVPGLSFKTTFTTTAATLTAYDRQPDMVMVGQMGLSVADLFARGQTTSPVIRYVQEDTYTNAATTVAEGATKPEAAFDTSEQDTSVRKIAVVAKVTEELFADFPMLRDYIDNRLRFMVAQTEESQLLTGDGNAPNILGVLNVSGIQTQAKGTDPVPDAVYKAMTKVRFTGFFEPDGVVMHPNDWQDVQLLRTADDQYIWGSPAMAANVPRIWGLPVDVTTAITQNTGLVGAFRLGGQVFYREGLRVESTNSNEDDFKKNLIALRAEQREALVIYRPKAFCTVTGI
jgi:HK97 family phage major capsid protein